MLLLNVKSCATTDRYLDCMEVIPWWAMVCWSTPASEVVVSKVRRSMKFALLSKVFYDEQKQKSVLKLFLR